MGLEDFSSDNKTQSNDTDDDETATEDDDSEETESGLESFKTDNKSTTKSEDKTESDDTERIDFSKVSGMGKSQRVRYIRENYVPDYHPSYQPDERWDFRRVIEISCICGNTFTCLSEGMCRQCGARYKDTGRTVVLESEPKIDTNEQIQES